ncbi:MAG: ATP-binding domain-containing protein [Dongiaceae bacterium]
MMVDDKKEKTLIDVGGTILTALETVTQAAREKLSGVSLSGYPEVLVQHPNPMVEGQRTQQNLVDIQQYTAIQLQRLIREPFVARVDVEWEHKGRKSVEVFYVTRASAADVSNVVEGARLATYVAPLGRLAEFAAGDDVSISVGGREKEGRILQRVLLHPVQQDGVWDAFDDSFEFLKWRVALSSLRRFLVEIGWVDARKLADLDIVGRLMREAAEAELIRERARRKVVERIALRDQPILDKFQGSIFRMPLDRQVMLFGPPGSGKTTTLIRRLAQKRTPEALTEDEKRLLPMPMREIFARPDSWAMFSPAELLKQYLGDAFNREGVPDSGNVRTWEKERRDLGRNLLGILRSSTSSGLQLDDSPDILIDRSSGTLSKLHDDFAAYAETTLLKRCNDAFESLLTSNDASVKRATITLQRDLGGVRELELREVLTLFDSAEVLQSAQKRLSDHVSGELRKAVNELLNKHKELLDEVVAALPALRGERREEDDEYEDDSEKTAAAPSAANARAEALGIVVAAIRAWARSAVEGRRSVGGRSGRVISLMGSRLPPQSNFAALGESIVTRSRLAVLIRAPRAFVMGVPGMYTRFRRQALRESRYFRPAAAEFFERDRISPDETDILILAMLRNARRVLQHPDGRRIETNTQQDWLENIKGRYLMQVFVDEATDLSATSLACTVELAYPTLRSWFACGDLRQRITINGMQSETEIDWLNRVTGAKIDLQQINISYRQSQRLRNLADALSGLNSDSRTATEPPTATEDADVWPLLGEKLSGNALAAWLANRTCEVEQAIGRLPSIAVFVDGDEHIDPLVDSTRKILSERNIPIVGCKEGRIVGDKSEVRVFDVQHIKGLEFEAVFFVGIDGLAERIPDLFQRFLYVGVTRAATYLGLTCAKTFPRKLDPVRSHFKSGGWS